MSYRVNTNIDAMNASYYLNLNQMSMSQSIEQLSSGLRINSAADDAAGLAISEGLESQVRGLNQATRNAQDGISMVQTADGAMNSVENMFQRMRELAVEASNGTMSSTDIGSVNTELQQLESQVNQISTQTKFNGLGLLDGSLSTGIAAASVIQNGFVVVAGTNTSVSNVNVSQAAAGTTYTFSNSAGKLTLSNGAVSQTIDLTGVNVAAGGSYNLNFNQLGVNLTISSVSGETGANIAAGLNTKTVTTAAGNSAATLQIGANAGNTMSVAFNKVDLNASSSGNFLGLYNSLSTFNSDVTGGASTSTLTTDAQNLITSIDSALGDLNTARANMGAYQNRLQDTVSNLQMNSNNLASAESQIKDVDVSSAMVNFTKQQILQQSGTAILAQANQAPSAVMSLLH